MNLFKNRQQRQAEAEIKSKRKIIPRVQMLARAQSTGEMVGTYGSEATVAETLAIATGERRDMMGHIRRETPKRRFE